MSEVEINETLPRVASETLLHFDQGDFLMWDINWHSIHPFRADITEIEKSWLAAWMVQAFDELIEMDQILSATKRFGLFKAEGAFIQFKLIGKYQYLEMSQIETRFRHLKALVRFIAEYTDSPEWRVEMNRFENGELEHS